MKPDGDDCSDDAFCSDTKIPSGVNEQKISSVGVGEVMEVAMIGFSAGATVSL